MSADFIIDVEVKDIIGDISKYDFNITGDSEYYMLDEDDYDIDKDEIKNSLTIEQVEQFLAEHGGEPVKRIGTLVSRTICHNPADGNGSHKLYYYENTHLFKCYTGCAETGGFDIFDLTRKIMKIQSNIEMSLYDAQIYIIN